MTTAERNSNRSESAIRRIAGDQHGVFTQLQAKASGISPSAITRRVQGGLWERVHPGVYRITGAATSIRQSFMAATLWAGDGSLLSHGPAARCWGIEGVRMGRVEVWVPSSCRKQSDAVVLHRGLRLDRADRAVLEGIPITTPTRTLIDIAGRLEDERLLTAMELAFRNGLTTPDRLSARLAALRRSGRAGSGRLEALLDSRALGAGAMESRLEARFWRLLLRSSVPTPVRQQWVVVENRRYRLDFAWPDRRVAVECDGWSAHGRDRFEQDERRRADLASVGWLVLPVTWKQVVEQPNAVIARLRRCLDPDVERFTAG
jgi:very-short-patch-repair endonuclease